MDCPSCHRTQADENAAECQFCGIIFEKWRAKNVITNTTVPASPPILLEVSSAEIFAYRVEPRLRTLFGLLLYFVDPIIRLIHPFIAKIICIN